MHFLHNLYYRGKKSSLQQQNPQSSGGQQQAQQLIPNQTQIDSSTNKRNYYLFLIN